MDIVQVITIIMIIFGAVLIVVGIFSYFRTKISMDGTQNRIRFDGILTIETSKGSFCFIGFGVILLVAALYFSVSFSRAKHSISAKQSQLSAVVPSGTALSLIPLDQLSSGEAGQKNALSARFIDQFKDIQDSTIGQLLKHSKDENFALLVLEGFDKNSFGLTSIPADRAHEVGNYLQDVSANYPDNAKLQLEIAKAFRSLYESREATKTARQQFLDRWGAAIDRLKKLRPVDDRMRYGISLISGLYYQRAGQLEDAKKYMSEADAFAPPEEKYKTNFNLGNIYLDSAFKEKKSREKTDADYKIAIEYLKKSEELARARDKTFWQPRFNMGHIYLRTEEYGEAAAAFLESYEIAIAAGEGDLFTQYLLKVKNIERLKNVESFAARFKDAFTAMQ